MADRYNRLDNTSPLQQHVENDKLNIPRSVFDLSHIHSGQALIGALTPVLCMETIPNQEFDINLNALIELRNPTTRKLLNGCRVFFHAYWSDCSDLWEGHNNFIDLGRSGGIHLNKPKLAFKGNFDKGDDTYTFNFNTPMSLMNMMGIPATALPKTVQGDDVPPLRYFQVAVSDTSGAFTYDEIGKDADFIDALPFVAYQKIWRDYYCNKNLLQNNKKWFPDNEDHFILAYDCQEAFCMDYENEEADTNYRSVLEGYSSLDITPEANNPRTYRPDSDYLGSPILAALKFRQFRGDRYTTALPFPDLVRGSIPSISDFSSDNGILFGVLDNSGNPVDASVNYVTYSTVDGVEPPNGDRFIGLNFDGLENEFGRISIRSSITMNDIRALEVFTVFKERMARTSGDYNDMIEAQFGFNPRQHTREAQYIGGCYQDLVFSSISQTSASTADSPLGSKAGQGVSSSNGRIGHFMSSNYGWLQIVMSIVPDVYYTQGLPKKFSRRVQEDNYFPVFNNLAPQAILNKELYISGDVSKDNDVFAFEERFSELKSHPNRVSGLSALAHHVAEYDSASVMARRFSSTPSFNSEFLTMVPENVDMDVFSFNDEPPFDFSIGFNISSVAPIPYTTVPGKMDLHA